MASQYMVFILASYCMTTEVYLLLILHDPSSLCFGHLICKVKLCASGKVFTNTSTAYDREDRKGKGEKERYTHLTTEFQRITRKPSSVINEKK